MHNVYKKDYFCFQITLQITRYTSLLHKPVHFRIGTLQAWMETEVKQKQLLDAKLTQEVM